MTANENHPRTDLHKLERRLSIVPDEVHLELGFEARCFRGIAGGEAERLLVDDEVAELDTRE